MSNKISGFTVTFENSVSEEYMDMIKQSLGLYKSVISVDPIVDKPDIWIGQSKERVRITHALIDFIRADFGDKK